MLGCSQTFDLLNPELVILNLFRFLNTFIIILKEVIVKKLIKYYNKPRKNLDQSINKICHFLAGEFFKLIQNIKHKNDEKFKLKKI